MADLHVVTDDGAHLAGALDGAGGTRPLVVLIHGWAAARRVWAPVVARLVAAGHPVVTYDQRGHGRSSLGTEPVTIGRLGRDLSTVLAAVDAADAVLVGHSGGGYALLAAAVDDPSVTAGRARGLVLAATAAHGQGVGPGEARLMGSGLLTRAVRNPVLGRRILRHTHGVSTTAAQVERTRALFAATPARVRGEFFAAPRDMDLRARLATVALPAVVLTGTADQVVAPAASGVLAEVLPGARQQIVPGAGHQLPTEVPHLIVDAVTELGL